MLIGIFLGPLGAAVYAQSATPNVPVTPIYGPPYHARQMPDYTPGLPNDSVAAAVSQWWAAYQVYWAYAFPGCSYTTQTYTPSIANGGLELGLTLHGTCGGGQGFYGTLQCPPGYKLSGNTCVGDKQLSVIPNPPTIPNGSGVVNGHVLTQSDLKLNVTEGDLPDANESVSLQSDRGSEDQIVQPGSTDTNGNAQASVSTRNQPGTSTITSATKGITTKTPGIINWLPAKYEGDFTITCYVISLESNYLKTRLATAPGIPGKQYHQGFLDDTEEQGTGRTLTGSYIKYDRRKHLFYPDTCARTASGICAVEGESSAVDRNVIPKSSSINIDGIGNRLAQDTGGGINGYHIDVFFGTERKACLQWGKEQRSVDFLSY
jgi:3D (Asp-Asp-Asp) domain-containing protein